MVCVGVGSGRVRLLGTSKCPNRRDQVHFRERQRVWCVQNSGAHEEGEGETGQTLSLGCLIADAGSPRLFSSCSGGPGGCEKVGEGRAVPGPFLPCSLPLRTGPQGASGL